MSVSNESIECFAKMSRSTKWSRFTLAYTECVRLFQKAEVKSTSWRTDDELKKLSTDVLDATKTREKALAIRGFIEYSKQNYITKTTALEKFGF